jgi:UDP-N-acetyl-D-mannosaminuronic acid dehydrogenase
MADVCVVGLGYVGLPTACAFARSGLDTVGVDVRPHVVELVRAGKSHLTEAGLEDEVRSAVGSGKLHATGDLGEAVSSSGAVVIAVQTPYQEGRVILDFLKAACAQVAASARPGSVLILESTVPTGTCEMVVLPILEAGGKREGKEFYFAYCPERIAPGNSLQEFVNNDRVIGAFGAESFERAEALMKRAVKGKIMRTSVLNAEAAKLVENAARDVYIAFANDLALVARRAGWDAREVIRLANTHPRVKILSPGPGVGGPCLTKDPYLLLEGLGPGDEKVGVTIRTARAVNDAMHREVMALLDEAGAPPQGSKVAVLGTAYKPEVGDPRGSPSEPVVKELIRRGYQVWTFDPFCLESFGARAAADVEQAAEGASCTMVLVAHRAFLKMDLDRLASRMALNPVIIDAVGAFPAGSAGVGHRLVRLGDGASREKLRHPRAA